MMIVRNALVFFASLILFGGTTTALAGLVRTADDRTSGNQQAYAGTILADDLINQGSLSFVNATQQSYNPFGNSEPANTVLNDGANGPDTNGGTNLGSAFDPDGDFQVTYTLNLASSPLGYDLTRIRSYAAHVDNRTGQNYDVQVALLSGGVTNFVSLGNFTGTNAGGSNQASRVTLENDFNPGANPASSPFSGRGVPPSPRT